MIKWLLCKIWEKINIVATWREIKELGKRYGKRFFWAAIIWESIEDIVLPYLSWRYGMPEIIPVFLIMHFEPIVYPAFFWGFRTYDRLRGHQSWEPNRNAYSHHWRSLMKGLTIQLAMTGWLGHILPWKELIIFTVLISIFGFVHERIWHDTNYGIMTNDLVQYRRPIVKTGTYLILSFFILFPIIRMAKLMPWWYYLSLALLIEGIIYIVLEIVWAKSVWGVVFFKGSHET
jgi:hypothetical protein